MSDTTVEPSTSCSELLIQLTQEHDVWKHGIALIRNCKYEEAKNLFQQKLQENENSVYFRLGLAEVAIFWAHLNFSKEYLDEAFSKIHEVENFAYGLVKKHKENAFTSFIKHGFSWSASANSSSKQSSEVLLQKRIYLESQLALAEMYAALATLKFKNLEYIKAAYYIRKSWKLYEALAKEIIPSGLEEMTTQFQGRVMFGLGIFHFVISMVPHSMIWLVQVIGFKGDRELALKELANSVRFENGRSDDSALVLAICNWFLLENKEESSQLLNSLLTKYPDGATYYLTLAFIQRREGNVIDSIESYQKCINSSEMPQLKLIAEYEMGHSHWLLCNWEKCAPTCDKYIKTTTSKQFRPFAAFKLGYCLWMMNQRDGIKELYSQIPGWVRSGVAFDRYALLKSEKFLKIGCFTPFDEHFFPILNCIEGRVFERGLELINELENFLSSYSSIHSEHKDDLFAQFYFVKAKTLHGLNNNSQAKEFLEKTISMEENLIEEKWTIPHSYLALGEIFEAENNFQAATDFYSKAKYYPTGYNFDRLIQLQVSKGMQKIQVKSKK